MTVVLNERLADGRDPQWFAPRTPFGLVIRIVANLMGLCFALGILLVISADWIAGYLYPGKVFAPKQVAITAALFALGGPSAEQKKNSPDGCDHRSLAESSVEVCPTCCVEATKAL